MAVPRVFFPNASIKNHCFVISEYLEHPFDHGIYLELKISIGASIWFNITSTALLGCSFVVGQGPRSMSLVLCLLSFPELYFPKYTFEKDIPRNIFLGMYFQKYISRNLFPEIYFQNYISRNIFPERTKWVTSILDLVRPRMIILEELWTWF